MSFNVRSWMRILLLVPQVLADYVIKKDMMENMEKMRKGRPLFLVDIAVPRDLDPAIAEMENAFLYDIDDLEGIVQSNLEERKKRLKKSC